MGLIKNFECIEIEQKKQGSINFFSLQFSADTFLYEIEPQSIDDLFCHHFQTDQLLVVRGSTGQTHQNLAQYRCFFVDCALSCQLIDRCGNIK